MNKLKKWGIPAGVFLVTLLLSYGLVSQTQSTDTPPEMAARENVTQWTCTMHLYIRKESAGKCPICAMDLVPVSGQETVDTEIPSLTLSKRAEALAEVALSPVVSDFPSEELSLSAKLIVDETRVETISAWFPGRIETLFIDYTGITVDKNTHMAEIYSPDLLVAQKELLGAKRLGSVGLIASSREKLRLWGFSANQIQKIETTGRTSDRLTIRASMGGTVLKKYVNTGEYVNTGSKLYDIANLDRLWFVAEVYEADVPKLFYGQKVTFKTTAYPGEIFDAVITFIDPVLDATSRTVRVRGIVDNTKRQLKPGMLAKATVKVTYAASGPIQDDAIKDLYVSPMHPEEFSDKPGNCPICKMPLKKASELGLVLNGVHKKPLLLPITAPLLTGERAVVYVKSTDMPGRYEGREVMLGQKVGDFYIVKHGLSEGEMVVTKGNFKIDSAMQIQAKPSMMQTNGSTGGAMSGHNH